MKLNAFVVVVDDLFSVIHATVTDLDCVTIKDFSKFVVFREVLVLEGLNYSMLNQIKLWCFLFLMALNHSITDAVFFH